MARQASKTGKERFTKVITAANKQPTPTSPTAFDGHTNRNTWAWFDG